MMGELAQDMSVYFNCSVKGAAQVKSNPQYRSSVSTPDPQYRLFSSFQLPDRFLSKLYFRKFQVRFWAEEHFETKPDALSQTIKLLFYPITAYYGPIKGFWIWVPGFI